jgi:HPt (histidine-containing phosphotransfer) domain-containing protein
MFLENGFNDYLSKPIDVRRLDAVLKKWIAAGKRRSVPDEDVAEIVVPPPEPCLLEIEGLDAAAGMARVGGSQERYRALLEMFRKDAAAGLAQLELEPAEEESALRGFTTLVHALKSALGNIGANDLSQASAALEKAGRDADLSAIRAQLPSFRERLAALTARIGGFLGASRPGEDEGETGPEIMDALARLRSALEAKDSGAMDAALAQAQSRLSAGRMRDAVGEVADFILTAEFGKAAKALDILLGE